MPIITKLSMQKNKRVVNLFLDNQFAFGLSLEEVVKKGLVVNQELNQEEVDNLFYSSNLQKLYNKTLNYLSFRPRSEREIKNYIKNYFRKNFTNESGDLSDLFLKIQDDILTKLKDKKLIDDLAFANWWLEQRLTFKPKGKRLIGLELKQKGVDQEIIEIVLSTVSITQLKTDAQKIAKKKYTSIKNLPMIKIKQKLYSYLARRGFDYEIIKSAVDEILQKE